MTFGRQLLGKIGMFDERMFFGCEDLDFCWRAVLAGFRVIYLMDILTFHMRERSTQSRLSAKDFAYEALKNKILTYLKCAPMGLMGRDLGYELLRSAKRCIMEPGIGLSIFRAWVWNMHNLRSSIRTRRKIYSRWATPQAGRKLDALIKKDRANDLLFLSYKRAFEQRISEAARSGAGSDQLTAPGAA